MAVEGEVKPGEAKPGEEGDQSAELLKILTNIGDRFLAIEEKLKLLPGEGDKGSATDIAALLAELEKGKGKPKGEEEEIDLEGVTNTELANILYDTVQKKLIQPIIERLEVMRMKGEIRECETKYPDFWDFKKDIWAEGSKNPSLTVEQAYIIVKNRSSGKKEEKKGEEKKAEEVKKPPIFGEKPGVTSSSTRKGEPKTIKEAAEQAFVEVFKEEKE